MGGVANGRLVGETSMSNDAVAVDAAPTKPSGWGTWLSRFSSTSQSGVAPVASAHFALEFDDHEIVALVAEGSGSRLRCRSAAVLSVPEHLRNEPSNAANSSALGEWLRGELGRVWGAKGNVLALVPRDDAILRRIDLPNVPDEELPDLVRFQAASKFAQPLDGLCLDFIPLPKVDGVAGRAVIAVAVPKVRVEGIRATCVAAGLQPVGVRFAPTSVAELIVRLDKGVLSRDELVLSQHRGRVEITALSRGLVVFSHWTRLSDSEGLSPQQVVAEVNRTLVAIRSQQPGFTAARLWLLLDSLDTAELATLLANRIGCAVERADLTKVTETGADSTQVATAPARFAGPLGALASRRDAWVPGLDFIAPRKAVVKPDLTKRRLQLAGIGAGLVALVFAVSTALEFRDLSAKTDALADEIRSMDELLTKGKPLVASHSAVEKWLAGQNEWLGEWRDLSRELPGTDRMFFESIRLEPAGGAKGTGAAMRLKGFARDREEVIKLTDAFVRNKDRYEISPHTARNTKDDAFYPWSVEVDIVSKPPKAVKGGGGKAVPLKPAPVVRTNAKS
jgi:hypothetical protein